MDVDRLIDDKALAGLERKDIEIELKDADEDGDEAVFTGTASVMGVKDLHGEIIDEGAFDKTLKKHSSKFALLADHDSRKRIGLAELSVDGKKLKIKGTLNIAKQIGKDVLSDIKFGIKHNIPLGLSIGFNTDKETVIDDVRHLQQIELWETSAVTFPANTGSRITGAKAAMAKNDFRLDLSGVISYCDLQKVKPQDVGQVEMAIKALNRLLSIPDAKSFSEFLDGMIKELSNG